MLILFRMPIYNFHAGNSLFLKLTPTIPVAFGDRFSLVRLVPGTLMEMNFLV